MIIPHFPEKIEARINLPASKSISNRVLVMNALGGGTCELKNRAHCDDTDVLFAALNERPDVVDIGAAGTAMRFGTAFFAVTEGERLITGSPRMKQRPIGVLVEALRTLGAEIDYAENAGFPPLRVKGKALKGGEAVLNGGVSSQYISALLMIGPAMSEGLTLRLEGDIISRPYIDMTLALMKQMGAQAAWSDERTLRAEGGGYCLPETFTVESDWSAASYWYEIVALCNDGNARIDLPLLSRESLQGDCRVADFFKPLGVKTDFYDGGLVLTKGAATHYIYKGDKKTDVPADNRCRPAASCADGLHEEATGDGTLRFDLVRQPDLAQTLVVTCAMLKVPFRFTGLQSLRIKETDRIAALQAELAKFGVTLEAEGDEAVSVAAYNNSMHSHDNAVPARDNAVPTDAARIAVDTYHDHRMAMAFAPCALLHPGFGINHPEVVTKSYPDFWNDITSLLK